MSSNRNGSKEQFSFHCIICYELLDPENRPPVVLPCGHTFLCEVCSKRLDKCMECRTPLVVSNPQPMAYGNTPPERTWANRPVSPVNTLRSAYSARGPPQPVQQARTAPPSAPISLPTPKNLVLISLLESMKRSSNNDDDSDNGSDGALVKESLQLMGSSCGTYVVRAKDGLSVYEKIEGIEEEGTWSNSFLSSFSRSIRESFSQPSIAPSQSSPVIKTLEYGQTVQISSFREGIATVARRKGYIVVKKKSDLVKVGEVKDEYTKLESKHRASRSQIEKLKKKIEKLESAQHVIKDMMKAAKEDPKPFDPFGPVPDKNAIKGPLPKNELREVREVLSFDRDFRKKSISGDSHVRSCGDIHGTNFKNAKVADADHNDLMTAVGCGDILRGHFDPFCLTSRSRLTSGAGPADQKSKKFIDQRAYRQNFQPSGSQMRLTGLVVSTSENNGNQIDFATGLSGHAGLTKKRSKHLPRREVRMLSEHKGAGNIGPCNDIRSNGRGW